MGVAGRADAEGRSVGADVAAIIGDERARGSSGRVNRMFVELVLWIDWMGSLLERPAGRVRRLEQRLSPVQSMERQGHLARIFAAMADDGHFGYLIVDSTIIRACATGLFGRSPQKACRATRQRRASGWAEFGDQVDAASSRDGQRGTEPDGWPPLQYPVRCNAGLVAGTRDEQLHLARTGGGVGRAR